MPPKLTLNAIMHAYEASKPAIDPKALPEHLAMLETAKQQFFKRKPVARPPAVLPYEHRNAAKSAYLKGYQDYMQKQAWIFSGPLGASDIPQLANVPKYLSDAVHGGSPEDSRKSTGRSIGMAGLAAMSGLFGLGFAGMGARDMALKLAVLAKKAKGAPLVTEAQRALAHKMEVPAYQRFGKAFEDTMPDQGVLSALKTPAKYTGATLGGIAHPFNKLEDYITRKMVSAFGPGRSESISGAMESLGTHPLVDNKATRFAGSMWGVPILVAGDSMFSPYHEAPENNRRGVRR